MESSTAKTADNLINSNDLSSSSSNTSPRRIYKNFKSKKKSSPVLNRVGKEDSDENDSDHDSILTFVDNFQNKNIEDDILYQLIKSIFEICIEVPVELAFLLFSKSLIVMLINFGLFFRNHTYNLHLEALNLLLVLLSVQMFTKSPTHESYIYETFMLKME